MLENNSIRLSQEKQGKKIKLIDTSKMATSKNTYIAERARGAYIASVCQPEASFDLSFAAQVINPKQPDAQALNRRLKWQILNKSRGLTFVKLDLDSLKLIAFVDGSFASNHDYSSQIGFIIVVADKYNNANILHWQSVKFKRVTRSVLASELDAMALGFDQGAAANYTIQLILQRKIPLIICIDSRSLYDCLVKLGITHEKRLMIDIMCLRESYEKREITEIRWIDGKNNPADAMTQTGACDALKRTIETNKIDFDSKEWVERSLLKNKRKKSG